MLLRNGLWQGDDQHFQDRLTPSPPTAGCPTLALVLCSDKTVPTGGLGVPGRAGRGVLGCDPGLTLSSGSRGFPQGGVQFQPFLPSDGHGTVTACPRAAVGGDSTQSHLLGKEGRAVLGSLVPRPGAGQGAVSPSLPEQAGKATLRVVTQDTPAPGRGVPGSVSVEAARALHTVLSGRLARGWKWKFWGMCLLCAQRGCGQAARGWAPALEPGAAPHRSCPPGRWERLLTSRCCLGFRASS